ncbi:sporulation protein YtfJ, partial [Paenibacillus sp. 28ISP30-2]|nr:sporulation protein YtfJ [Paenibacillus sp. 28ISP30-2]
GKEGHPFGGGSGGGVSIHPIAFLVVGKQGAQIVPLDNQTHLIEKLIDSTPYLIDKVQSIFRNAGGDLHTPPPQVPVDVTTDHSHSGPAYL